jgi:quinol monooxygenase YgiN
MVQLIVTVTTRPGRADDYVAAFAKLASQVRQEKGCIEYGIYRDSIDRRFDNEVRPDTVILCEKWESVETLQRHTRSSPALMKFREAVKEIKLKSRYQLLVPAMSS